MLKTLMAEIKEYKKPSLLAPLFVSIEVFMEILIPFLMSKIVDMGISEGSLKRGCHNRCVYDSGSLHKPYGRRAGGQLCRRSLYGICQKS